MTLSFGLVRPDDLLNLWVEGENLRLDSADPEHPALVVDEAGRPAYLIFRFPPQSIAERAYFQFSTVPPPPKQFDPDVGQSPAGNQTPEPPVPARLGQSSRLVFRLPADARIAFATDALLDWSRWELNVAPIADLPVEPTPEQVAGAGDVRPPTPTQTALQLPDRLTLSTSHRVTWLHAAAPVTHGGRTELWHTRLAVLDGNTAVPTSRARPAPMRAIWSADYDPDHPPALSTVDPDLGMTAMSARDRHEIVALTSAFNGYVTADYDAYRPTPIQVELLMLSPLGGWLRSRASWDPPYTLDRPFRRGSGRDWRNLLEAIRTRRDAVGPGALAPQPARVVDRPVPPALGIGQVDAVVRPVAPGWQRPLGPQLNISEWVHRAAQGRDHYVRIVYDGYLYPPRIPASLVKVTERKFVDIGGSPVAYLVQHMNVVARRPEMDYTREPMAYGGREFPFTRIELTTTVTPDIVHPKDARAAVPGSDYSFWVMVDAGAGVPVDFPFHAVAYDVAGHRIDLTMALIFVPNSESHLVQPDPAAAITSVREEYRRSGARRTIAVPGQRVTYVAPPVPAPPTGADNTTLLTEVLYLDMQDKPTGVGSFLPRLQTAQVRVPAVEHLVGQNTATTIAFYRAYLDGSIANQGGVFATIVDKLDVKFPASAAGGIATPNLDVRSLSREFGPLAGDVAKAAANSFDPAGFFPTGTAKLFGVVDLARLLPHGAIGDHAPTLRTAVEPVAGGQLAVTTLDWRPGLLPNDQIPNFGILALRHGDDATLTIHTRIERPVRPPGGPGSSAAGPALPPGHTRITGELTNFTLEFLNVMEIRFRSFRFTAESGRAMDVQVTLDDSGADHMPFGFAGDLQFLDDLREYLPPGLFGAGPSIDVDASRIRAGFAIALPPVAIAVFALKDVSLSAALELPFADGSPVVDLGFAQRQHPFLLTVALFGGGGFIHVQLDTKGVRQLEAALEFGACAALDIGVASGSVHIMAGIYFSLGRDKDNDLAAVLSGYLRCGGELSVLGLVSISVEFNLSFTYDSGSDKATGRATLTVSVDIAFFHTSVELTVERSFGGNGGDPSFRELFHAPDVWQQYAEAFA